jgi:hypothetical protein
MLCARRPSSKTRIPPPRVKSSTPICSPFHIMYSFSKHVAAVLVTSFSQRFRKMYNCPHLVSQDFIASAPPPPETLWSLDSSVGIATGYGLDDRGVGVRVPVESRIFSSTRPDRPWGSPNLLSNGYWGLFPRRQSGWGVKLTTHLQLVPRSR